jgi:hypothetical protein
MLRDTAIVDGAKARLIATGLASGNVHADYGLPTDDDVLPLVNVFVPADDGTPAGNAPRTGTTHLEHATTLVVEVFARANSARAVKAYLGQAAQGITQALLSDLDWATDANGPFIEGYGRVRRIYDQPPEGNHLLGRVQLQIDVLHAYRYEPDASGLPDLSGLTVSIDLDPDSDDAPVIGADIDLPD